MEEIIMKDKVDRKLKAEAKIEVIAALPIMLDVG